jgi:type IV pilus assembly protein PilN
LRANRALKAMNSFNFLPYRTWALAQRRQRFLGRLVGGACWAVLALLLQRAWLGHLQAEQGRVQGVLQAALLKLAQNTASLDGQKPALDEVKAHYMAIRDLQAERNASVHLFNRLLPLVPGGLSLTQLSLAAGQVDLQGQAQQPNQVTRFFQELNASPAFDQVEWRDFARQSASPQALGLGFSLRAHLRLPTAEEMEP